MSTKPSREFPHTDWSQPPAGPPPRPRWWSRRLVLMAAVVGLVLSLVAGYFVWPSSSVHRPPAANGSPFYYALENLYASPIVHYSGSTPGGGTSWDLSVTGGGEELGTFTTGGQQTGVLRVGGIAYVKPPPADLALLSTSLPVSALQGQWIAGDTDATSQLPQGLVDATDLSTELLSDITKPNALPLVGAPTVQIDGRQALAARIPSGKLYVSTTSPYQVLRIASDPEPPPTPYGPSATPDAVTTGPHVVVADVQFQLGTGGGAAGGLGDLGQSDLDPMTQADVDQTYDNLIDQTETLNTAPDIGIITTYNHSGNLSCSDSDCTVTEDVTSSTTSTQAAELSGNITMDMTATVTADGESAGSCNQTQSLPINGSGTITCDDPQVAPIVQQIEAQEQDQADAEGQDLSYTIDFEASVQVETMADVQAEVQQQVQTEQSEQNVADANSDTCAVEEDSSSFFSRSSIFLDALSTALSSACQEAINEIAAILQNAAKEAAAALGPGQGHVYGTHMHSKWVEILGRLKRSDLHFEVSYLHGFKVTYGQRGAIRVDVVFGDENNPIAIFDLKTGSAELTLARIARIQAQLPPGHDPGKTVPVFEVRQ